MKSATGKQIALKRWRGRMSAASVCASFLYIWIFLSQNTCSLDYQKIPQHTMCLTDKKEVTHTGVTLKEQEKILQLHNDYRSRVNPPAADLTTLVWNEELAAVAQKWSQQCRMGHDEERSVPGDYYTIKSTLLSRHFLTPWSVDCQSFFFLFFFVFFFLIFNLLWDVSSQYNQFERGAENSLGLQNLGYGVDSM